MTSWFDTLVGNRRKHTPWARVNVAAFMREMLWNAPHDYKCPQCGGPVESVDYPSDSYLNPDQWASQRAGDYRCRSCPPNDRSARNTFCYWWRHEIGPKAAEYATVLRVTARPDVSSREWWEVEWTGADGKRASASAQYLDLCMWRAAEHEMQHRMEAEHAAPDAGDVERSMEAEGT